MLQEEIIESVVNICSGKLCKRIQEEETREKKWSISHCLLNHPLDQNDRSQAGSEECLLISAR